MLSKKFIAILTVCILMISIVSVSLVNLNSIKGASALIDDDFEDGLAGWGPRGTDETAETVEISTEQAHSGTQSAKISNRSNTWHGIMADKTNELTLGMTYTFGVWIKYVGDSYSNTHNFSLQLQYSDGVSDNYKNIKTSAETKGNWTYLEGTYTMPTDAADINLYVETQYNTSPSAQDLMDFYIDDFTAIPADLPEIETNIASLKDVYKNYFKLGGAAQASEVAIKPGKELFLKHYNSITFGNELKPDAVLDYDATVAYMEENPGDEVNPQVNIRSARTLMEFAQANNIPVRGHTLVWHNQTPDWFFRVGYSKETSAAWASKEVMLQRLENYIKNLMQLIESTYPDVEFYAWDVVNEAVDPNTSTGMRNPGSNNTTSGNSLWMQTVGSDFIEKAFEYARKYAPEGCKLFYNDYNEYETAKMNYIVNILTSLKAKNLVDGMGMQSHWTMDYPSLSMVETAIRKYDSLGLEVQLTELDIKQPDGSSSALTNQATRYKTFMSKVVDLKKEGLNITAVVFWGVTDATSWLGGYPLLFDADYKAKPAFYSVVEAAGTSTTTTSTTTAPTSNPPTTSSTITTSAPTTTTTTTTTTSNPPTTSSVTGSSDIAVTYNASNSWGSGATVSVTLKNNGTSAKDGWSVSWTFPGDQKISNLWCGKYTQSGASVTVTNESWNSNIPAGGSVNFGFNLSFSSSNTNPTSFTVK